MAIDYCYAPETAEWEDAPPIFSDCGTPPQNLSPSSKDEWFEVHDAALLAGSIDLEAPIRQVIEGAYRLGAGYALDAEIERAERLVGHPSEAEGQEDTPFFAREALDRAASFLKDQARQVRRFGGSNAPVPVIGPGPDASVDLHWQRENWELLVNIPSDLSKPATFYGDDYGVQKIKGSFDPSFPNSGILTWLMKS